MKKQWHRQIRKDSVAAKRSHSARVQTHQTQQSRDRALHALNDMRRLGMSLTQAAAFQGTTPATVKKYAGPALRRKRTGRYRVTPSDRFTRRLEFLTPKGKIAVTVRGSRAASQIATYHNAVKRFADTGEAEGLQAFEGRTLRVGKTRLPFVTDLDLLRQLAEAAELSLDSLYVRG